LIALDDGTKLSGLQRIGENDAAVDDADVIGDDAEGGEEPPVST
jgi:DNA gyrase subunit A